MRFESKRIFTNISWSRMLSKEEIIQICRDSLIVTKLPERDKYSFKLYFETVADKILGVLTGKGDQAETFISFAERNQQALNKIILTFEEALIAQEKSVKDKREKPYFKGCEYDLGLEDGKLFVLRTMLNYIKQEASTSSGDATKPPLVNIK